MATKAKTPSKTPIAAAVPSAPVAPAAAPVAPAAAPVAPATPSLGDAGIVYATAAELGKTFGRSAIREASDIQTFALSFKHAGCETSFEMYEAFAADFKAAAKDAGWQAPQDLWERTCATARGLNLIGDKPKSTAPAATAKKAQRAKAAEAVKGKTAAELKAEADAAAKAGDLIKAGELAKMAERAAKTAAAEAAKAAAAKVQPLIDKLAEDVKVMKKAGDVQGLTMLLSIADALAAGKHATVAKALKAFSVKA
jgi:hypothetical protein